MIGKISCGRAAKGFALLTAAQLTGQINQFKAFIDLCHLYGISVIADVVYNHAGGGFDDQSIKFFDRQPYTSDNNSLYLTDKDHAGGRVFAYSRQEVRQFLIDNGKSLLQEYHVDGLRYDQVTVIAESGGWYFAQDLTNTLRYVKPEAVQIAEYWDNDPGIVGKALPSRRTEWASIWATVTRCETPCAT
jgi:1,4-alpha-glucan branching enzyme